MDEYEQNEAFRLPQTLLDKIYSFTGATDKHKGMLMVYISENGEPVIYTKFQDKPSEVCILSTAKDFIEQVTSNKFQGEQ
jgi:hypothetical protein